MVEVVRWRHRLTGSWIAQRRRRRVLRHPAGEAVPGVPRAWSPDSDPTPAPGQSWPPLAMPPSSRPASHLPTPPTSSRRPVKRFALTTSMLQRLMRRSNYTTPPNRRYPDVSEILEDSSDIGPHW
jgi:hypothetical protein